MALHITNTVNWTDVEGRQAKPSFTLRKLLWRGEGEDVYLVGMESSEKRVEGYESGVDYVSWDKAPQWALDDLEAHGVSLNGTQETAVEELPTDEEPVETTIQANSVEELSIEDEPVDSEGDFECPSDY